MLSPVLLRGSAVYSPVLPQTASSSQPNLFTSSSSRPPPLQAPGSGSQQYQRPQAESHQSSQSSRHSSYKQHHPSLLPHVESHKAQPPEDGVSSALDGLTASQSLVNGVGNISQTSLGYGTMGVGMGASATGRRFQIHRGRPPSRTKPTQNGVSPAGGAGDEVRPMNVDQ